MTFVFDDRPSVIRRYAGTVYDAFKKWVQPPPQLTGCAFLRSKDVRPLQAADLIAWELYQHANDILKEGLIPPKRKEFRHLAGNMDFAAQIATRKSLIAMRAFWQERSADNPQLLKEMTNHFTYFDPENPDYSYLYGKQPS